MTSPLRLANRFLLVIGFLFLLAACSLQTPSPTSPPEPSPTPSMTPIPLAFSVNGQGITRAEFEAEVARYQQVQAGLGNTLDAEEAARIVRDDLVDQLLLASAAEQNGFQLEEGALQARIDALAEQIGGAEVLAAWQAANGYTDEEFRLSLGRQVAAAWMRDRVIAEVPGHAEQVHVRQILFQNAEDARDAYALLQAGWDFDALAAQYDPVTRGELGWFPRGYLDQPAIEEAAFALQPGGYTAVVESSVGFHILFVAERDLQRLLSPDALLTLQQNTLKDWLTEQRNTSTIVIEP